MRVFSVAKDLHACQEVRMEKSEGKTSLMKTLVKRIDDWNPPECYIHDLRVKPSNFFNFGKTLVFDVSAKNGLIDIFESAGQVLPLEVEGAGTLYLLHVLENIEAYDEKSSDKLNAEEGNQPGLKKIVFRPDRFGDSSIFKLSAFPFSPTFTYRGKLDIKNEFIGRYAELGLTGLKFIPVWTDSGHDVT